MQSELFPDAGIPARYSKIHADIHIGPFEPDPCEFCGDKATMA